MKEVPYWVWMKREKLLESYSQPSMNYFNNSWEEKAFAEDAAGPLGGCIWPPRSYSCSFCRREFRSAQALGGHMNVHRRDRARLKQSDPRPSLNGEACSHDQNQYQNRSKSLGAKFCKFRRDRNPKSSTATVASGALSPASWVSASNTTENFREQSTFASAQSSYISQSWSDPVGVLRLLSISESKPGVENNLREGDCTYPGNADYVETDFSIGRNLFVSQNRPTGSCGVEAVSCKRPKIASSSLSFSLRACSNDRSSHLQSRGTEEPKSNNIEDLDLELRLGDPPTLK